VDETLKWRRKADIVIAVFGIIVKVASATVTQVNVDLEVVVDGAVVPPVQLTDHEMSKPALKI